MDELTASQLAEWEAFYTISPFDDVKEDLRYAHLCSLIMNLTIQVNAKKGTKLTEAKDFLIEWDSTAPKEQKVQSVEDMKKFLLEFAKKHNKNIEKQTVKNKIE